jgi:ribonuclease HII
MPRTLPDLSFEIACGPGRVVCGVDEVGRGPLAGPVTAAAVILRPGGLPPELAARVNDSKALSIEMRERIAPGIREHALAWAIAEASVAEIDNLNILRAALLAMKRAVEALGRTPDVALVDGRIAPDLACAVQCIVKGDALSQSIACASILAKIDRDDKMAELARDFPEYGWDRNAGYPTPEHKAALAKHGVTPHHRRSFAPVKQQLAISG